MSHIDKTRVRQAFGRAADGFDTAAFLHDAIRERLLGRLELLDLQPATTLDLGAGTLAAAPALARRFPGTRLLALDASAAMLRAGPPGIATVCGDAEALPFAAGRFELIVSNLLLHWCADLPGVLAECRRILTHPGALCFAAFGPDTLQELRTAWQLADGTGAHVMPFVEMHDLGDLLVSCGFSEPVLDREVLTVTYGDPRSLFEDLRGTASVNALTDRRRGLTGRATWQRMIEALEAHCGADGRFGVTVEIIYGQAWSGPAGNGSADQRRLSIPVEVIR